MDHGCWSNIQKIIKNRPKLLDKSLPINIENHTINPSQHKPSPKPTSIEKYSKNSITNTNQSSLSIHQNYSKPNHNEPTLPTRTSALNAMSMSPTNSNSTPPSCNITSNDNHPQTLKNTNGPSLLETSNTNNVTTMVTIPLINNSPTITPPPKFCKHYLPSTSFLSPKR